MLAPRLDFGAVHSGVGRSGEDVQRDAERSFRLIPVCFRQLKVRAHERRNERHQLRMRNDFVRNVRAVTQSLAKFLFFETMDVGLAAWEMRRATTGNDQVRWLRQLCAAQTTRKLERDERAQLVPEGGKGRVQAIAEAADDCGNEGLHARKRPSC